MNIFWAGFEKRALEEKTKDKLKAGAGAAAAGLVGAAGGRLGGQAAGRAGSNKVYGEHLRRAGRAEDKARKHFRARHDALHADLLDGRATWSDARKALSHKSGDEGISDGYKRVHDHFNALQDRIITQKDRLDKAYTGRRDKIDVVKKKLQASSGKLRGRIAHGGTALGALGAAGATYAGIRHFQKKKDEK